LGRRCAGARCAERGGLRSGARAIESICRVCGYDDVGEERWTARDVAEYVICPCCGAESGFEDDDLRLVREYRTKWVQAGCSWFNPDQRPDMWSLDPQAEHIPEAWR
jgi:hypothetical protein